MTLPTILDHLDRNLALARFSMEHGLPDYALTFLGAFQDVAADLRKARRQIARSHRAAKAF